MRSLQLLTVTAALAASIPAQWAAPTLTTFPTQRRAGAAAFDTNGNRLIFLGGVASGPAMILPQTWAYNGTWTLLAPPNGTIGRWGHQMVRNTVNNHLIAFGGRSPTISGFANDTVEWNGTQWNNVPTPAAPSPRYHYGMAFDQQHQLVVLFGGRTSTATLNDTWQYDGITWTPRTFATSPLPRGEMAMVYDASLGRTVLFGGYDPDTNTVFGDTWHYDGSEWLQQAPTASPSARYTASCVYDSVRQRIVLYGGYTGAAIVTDTYEYTGNTWNTVATPTAPPASTETLHGYDPVRRKFVLFGGFGGTFSSQTWEYTGATTGFFSTFGTACPTPSGEVLLTSNTPRIGQSWDVTLATNPPTPYDLDALGLVVLGFSDTTWNGLPLPLDLAAIGLSGCELLVSADVIATVLPNPQGASTIVNSLAIPNNTALINSRVFVQGILTRLLPSLTFVGTTKGGRAILGNQ